MRQGEGCPSGSRLRFGGRGYRSAEAARKGHGLPFAEFEFEMRIFRECHWRCWMGLLLAGMLPAIGLSGTTASGPASPAPAAKIIFDTDLGNDVDDVLALAMLHALQSRGACELLGVTISNPTELAGPFAEAINGFYGRPNIPVGCVPPWAKPGEEASKYLGLIERRDAGRLRYPHRLKQGSRAPTAVTLLRQLLSAETDGSVILVQVGYFSNLAALLASGPDRHSPLAGPELVRRKVKLLSVMAGAFTAIGKNPRYLEFNVVRDLPAAQTVAADWPTPVVWSGFEIGIAVPYPAASIERDFGYARHHPVAESYYLYRPPPHNRPSWDLTAVLCAVFPDRGYFDLSEPGEVRVEADGFTRHTPSPSGRDRFLILRSEQKARVLEALVQLASQPPCRK